jgi:serine/threonine protein kinase/tetratricopeptide (TPR) repeat protein
MPIPGSPEKSIFLEAIEKSSAAERAAFLDEACKDDVKLLAEVEALLRAHEAPQGILDAAKPARPMTDGAITEGPGTVIGPYKLLEQIGEGGMGVVYMAEQTTPLRRKVALKIIKPGMDTRQVVARFECERQALALMDHPNIAKVFDAGATGQQSEIRNSKSEGNPQSQTQNPKLEHRTPEHKGPSGARPDFGSSPDLDFRASNFDSARSDFGFGISNFDGGRPYFVMELVRGIPITDYCDRNCLAIDDRLELFVQVCQAVQHAHQKGIIHRDIKPSNILVTLIDGAAVPKIIDFGVAKAMGQQLTEKTMFTGFAQLIGTPLYMSPEQAAFSGVDVDTRSDIYSLGVLLYEFLTGTTPFDAETLRTAGYDEIRRIIREEVPPKPSTRIRWDEGGRTKDESKSSTRAGWRRLLPFSSFILHPSSFQELDWIVMKCLEKDRNRRYETANTLVADLRRHLNHEPVEAGPPSPWYRLRKLARRNRAILATTALVVAALLVGTAVSTWQAIRATNAEGEARVRLKAEQRARGEAADQRNLVEQRRLEAERERGAAREAERRANDERDKARRAEAKTEAINQFLVQNILTFSPPGRFGYRESESTVAEVLEEASRKVETAFPGQPELEASLRLTIGNTFFRMAKFKEAEVHLRKALNLRGHLLADSADPWGREYAEIAFATRRLGLALQALGRNEEAKSFLLRGGEARRRIEIRRIPFRINAFPFTLHPLGVVFSPDGRWLLALGDDDCLYLYDVATGAEIHRWLAHGVCSGLAFSPDGRYALTGHHENTVRLWDVFRAKQLRQFTGHTGPVYFVAFSPDGRQAISASSDRTFRLWDAQSGREVRQFLGHTDRIHNASFSPDGSRVLSASQDGTLRLWEVATGAQIRCFPKTQPAAGLAVLSPDGRRALSTHADGLHLWDVETGEEVRRIPDAAGFGGAVFTPHRRHAVSTGDTTGKWCLWDLDTGKEVRSYYVEPPLVPKGVEVSPDGRLAVCGNWRGSISIWRLGNPPPLGHELVVSRQNYEQKRRELGPDTPETLQALDELAALHQDRAEPADAEPLFRQSLESKKRLLGLEHPATLAAMKNLIRVLQAREKLPEAEMLIRQCLETYRRVQGPEHPDVLVASDLLGDLLEGQGKPDEALVLWRQCVEGWERLYCSTHSISCAAASKLVLKLQTHGKPPEPGALGPSMGYIYVRLGQWDKAVRGLARAFDSEVPKNPQMWLDYACLLVQAGDTHGYRKLCGRLLERIQENDRGVIFVLAHAFVLAPQAVPDAGTILELAQKRMASADPGSPDLWSIHVLALAYYRAGRFDKAGDCLSGFLSAKPTGDHDVANWLVQAMVERHLGREKKAGKWLRKADHWIEAETPKIGQRDCLTTQAPEYWRPWVQIQLLHREAEALIRGKAADRLTPDLVAPGDLPTTDD